MANPRATILTLILLFLLLAPDAAGPSLRDRLASSRFLATERRALAVLADPAQGLAAFDPPRGCWLNLTALRAEDGLRWDLLAGVRERVTAQMARALGGKGMEAVHGMRGGKGHEESTEAAAESARESSAGGMVAPMYRNVSGMLRGEWVRSTAVPTGRNATAPVRDGEEGWGGVNLTNLVPERTYASREYVRNVTGPSGRVRIRLREDEKEGTRWKGWTKGQSPEEREGEDVKSITAEVDLSDEDGSGDRWQAKLHGVHFVKWGGIILSTTSEKFPGIFALPYFTTGDPAFGLAKSYLNRTLHTAVDKQEREHHGWMNPWASSLDGTADGLFSSPHCEYVLYLQQDPLAISAADRIATLSQTPIDMLENELRFPSGYHGARPHPLSMSMVLFSPDCGVVLESKGPPDFAPAEGRHLRGAKIEAVLNATRRHALLYAATITCQILLLVRQMKDASTPSTLSRVSFYTIAIMSLGDGFGVVVFVPLSMFVESAFLPLLTTGFMAFVAVTFFDLRFLMDIWTVQAQERRRQARSSNAGGSPRAETPQPPRPAPVQTNGSDTLPLPVSAPRRPISPGGAIPIIIPSDQDLTQPDPPTPTTTTNTDDAAPRRELGSLYSRFYFTLFGLALLTLHASTWPRALRAAYANLLAFLYLSFWVPQIVRNVARNARNALGWRFIAGQSVLRLVPIAYLWAHEGNVAFLEVDAASRRALLALAAWVWAQVLALTLQALLGPRAILACVGGGRTVGRWLPPVYDYHPILREDEEAGNLPVGMGGTGDGGDGASRPASPAGSRGGPEAKEKERDRRRGRRVFDCAICMHNLEVVVVTKDASGSTKAAEAAATGPAGLLARRTYMVTPCRHIFHTECLEGWMKYRLQCPICRETLPPL